MEVKIIPSSSSFNVLALLLTFLLGISNVLADAPAAEISSKNYTNYLQKACHSTTYPQLCLESLSSYTSTIETDYLKLCSTALTVTLKAASNTSSLVKALSKQRGLSKTEAGIIKDCIEETGDSVDELKRSLDAFGSLQGSDIQFQISNIQTWISAAITDENTCTQGFDDRKISDEVMRKIRMKIVIVARLTSNALALINKFKLLVFLFMFWVDNLLTGSSVLLSFCILKFLES
ncbi:hypothetical protein OIU85_009522 [Salix viminalis]|uniref:Pectinesterase inhibitor domain-containing protein n=1 Tax=Salix viminalis TaxID=40686 RepID=A0A9Q0NUN8_SALVM|nr:hypothetical protein OIU85_009522 [Salix viminalis]